MCRCRYNRTWALLDGREPDADTLGAGEIGWQRELLTLLSGRELDADNVPLALQTVMGERAIR